MWGRVWEKEKRSAVNMLPVGESCSVRILVAESTGLVGELGSEMVP